MPKTFTIKNTPWSVFDDRAWAHPGTIVDLGCGTWNWSEMFIGKKHVVGADPYGSPRPGVVFFKGCVEAFTGVAGMGFNGEDSSLRTATNAETLQLPTLSWRHFLNYGGILSVAILKVNIEGSEWSLLNSMSETDFEIIDQITVGFHDFLWPDMRKATESTLQYLRSVGYDVTLSNPGDYAPWYLCLKHPGQVTHST